MFLAYFITKYYLYNCLENQDYRGTHHIEHKMPQHVTCVCVMNMNNIITHHDSLGEKMRAAFLAPTGAQGASVCYGHSSSGALNLHRSGLNIQIFSWLSLSSFPDPSQLSLSSFPDPSLSSPSQLYISALSDTSQLSLSSLSAHFHQKDGAKNTSSFKGASVDFLTSDT